MSSSKSSPLRPTTKRAGSEHHTPPPSSQAELKKQLFESEIRGHAWEFDAQTVAKMLSADVIFPSDVLVNSAYGSLKRAGLPVWPDEGAEQRWYPPLQTFLNGCVEACNGALDGSQGEVGRDKRWYGDLNFIVYDRLTEDGIHGSAPLEPHLVGGLGLNLNPTERAAWSPIGQKVNQVLLPVEVKNDWAQLVAQAATYARCLFSASPSRQFALTLGFQQSKAELRFLVFHRGGLTSSKPLSVQDKKGQQDILRIFLSILNWKSSIDAGFLDFSNDIDMFLPLRKNEETGVVATLSEVLHDGLCVLGRASRVLLMEYAPPGKALEPKPEVSTPDTGVRTRGRRKAEAQAKQEDETSDTLTYLIEQRDVTISSGPPGRTPVTGPKFSDHARWSSGLDSSSEDGRPIHVVVKHSWCEVSRRGVEAELLNKCKSGFGTPDHCYSFCPKDSRGQPMSTARFLPGEDEESGKFCWRIGDSAPRDPHPQRRQLWVHVSKRVGRSLVHAKTPWDLCLAVGSGMLGWLLILKMGFLHRDISIGNILMLEPLLKLDPSELFPLGDENQNELNKYIKQLEGTVKKMGLSKECHGFVIDGDMAASLDGYFTPRKTGERSGTYEFMSDALLNTLDIPKDHLHSPIDDLDSFFFTMQWAAAFNDGASGKRHDTREIQHFRDMISGRDRAKATIMVRDTLDPDRRSTLEEYGSFFTCSLSVLAPWIQKLVDLRRAWRRSIMNKAEDLGDEEKETFLRSSFLIWGYRGVAEYLELVYENRALMQEEV